MSKQISETAEQAVEETSADNTAANKKLSQGESRTKKFMHNSFSTAIYQVILMIAGFITPKVMLSFYGSEINGLVSSIQQFMTYFQLVEAGISSAAVFSLYLPLAEKNHKRINAIVSASRNFYFQSGYIFVGLVGVLAVVYPLFVHTDQLSPLLVGLLVVALGGKGFMDFFTLAKYRVLLTADQRTYIISIASSIYVILNTIIIVVLSTFRMNVVVVYAMAILSMYVRSLVLKIYVKKHYKFIDYHEKPDNQALNKRWDALFLQLVGTVQKSAPTVIATIFTSLKAVSVYSIYNMVLVGVNEVLGIFITGLPASFGDVIARGEQKTLQKSFKEFSYGYYSMITVVYSVCALMIVPFVTVYTKGVTDIQYAVPIIGFLFTLNGLLYNIKTPQGMLIFSAGMFKETRVQTSIQAGIIIVFGSIFGYIGNTYFGGLWGIAGILIASCLSNLYRVIDMMIFVPKYITHLPVSLTIIRYLRIVASMAIIMLPFFFIEIKVTNIFTWALWAIVVGVYSVVVVLVMGLIFERDQIFALIRRVQGLLPNKLQKVFIRKK